MTQISDLLRHKPRWDGMEGNLRTSTQAILADNGGRRLARSRLEESAYALDDENLVIGLQRRDQSAVMQAYRSYSDAIYRYACYQLGDSHLAEDVVSDVFLRMIEKIDTFRCQGVPFKSWLYRIAHNLIADHFRRQGKMRAALDSLIDGGVAIDPARFVESKLTVEQLQEALQSLTKEQRRVVLLKFVGDMHNGEVAISLGKSEGAIKSLQHRALEAMRRMLEGREGGCGQYHDPSPCVG